MKQVLLFIVCALPYFAALAGNSNGFRYWERLSIAFDEFSVEADGSLHGRLNGFTDVGFFMKIGSHTSYVSKRERPFALKPGEELTFWRSRSAPSSIRMLSGDAPEITRVEFPEQMRGERRYLRIRMGKSLETFVGVDSRKAYIPAEKTCIDFPLPFKSIWPDQKDYDLWGAGVGFRYRLRKVDKISEGEKRLAADLSRYFSATNLQCIVGPSCVGGTTNVQVAVTDELTKAAPGLVAPFFVQITGTNSQFRVSGFSFVTQDDKCRHARRYRFDAQGRFTYGWRVDRVNENGAPGRVALDMSFEYDAEGKLRRAWTPGDNPLMIDKGNKLYFTGDPELAIEYRKEVHLALDGLPRLK